jgi:hypothetical protein
VAVYATNTPNSRILKMLNKGDLVWTDLAVIDSRGHWRRVWAADERISGYVNVEDLAPQRRTIPR